MSENAEFRVFDSQLDRLIKPHLADLAVQLESLAGLTSGERQAVENAAARSLYSNFNRRLSRVLVLELNAARVEGRLEGATSTLRWQDFMQTATTAVFWDACFAEYPALQPRLDVLISNRCRATVEAGRHWAEDRASLSELLGTEVGELNHVSLGKGDHHRQGRAVGIFSCAAGPIVYKPRPLDIDAALHRFIAALSAHIGEPLLFSVPDVLLRNQHGWARHVDHRFVETDAELKSFYRGVGQTLALMRLLGGTDFHAENLIACAGTPMLVDCETLFTPNIAPFPSGYGQAFDRSMALATGGVLAIGLLPERGQGLGWRGIDMSGIGGLADQQPEMMIPGLVDQGLDTARIKMVPTRPSLSKNHPSAQPAISRFWPDIIAGFDDLTATLRALDTAGILAGMLSTFEGAHIRVVVRTTEMYAEIERMLWHPVSLKNHAEAKKRAAGLLKEMGDNISFAPNDPEVIAAEVEDLCVGDVPYFWTIAEQGQLKGPQGHGWLAPTNLIEASLSDWRGANLHAEQGYIKAAIVSAYVNDGVFHKGASLWPACARGEDVETRRRRHAAAMLQEIRDNASYGDDGTVSWVAPSLTQAGWSVAPLGPDLYAGLSGIAVLVGAYVHEEGHGRADPVHGLHDLLTRLQHTLSLWEQKQDEDRRSAKITRPPPTGGFVGLGSQIWALLALSEMAGTDQNLINRAMGIARNVEWAATSDDSEELLYGRSGAIVPLLRLAKMSGSAEPIEIAVRLGETICENAVWDGPRAYWRQANSPDGLGGFAHGVTGIGWALRHLASATGDDLFHRTANGAFAFEAALFDDDIGNWLDLRQLEGVTSSAAWCHGAVGIGLAHLDIDPGMTDAGTRLTIGRAMAATQRFGLGWNHCICHGDFGAFDLFGPDIVQDLARPELKRRAFVSALIASLDEHGATCGVVKDAFVPSLFTGLGGVAYQLLRAHPGSRLPSPLTLGAMAA